MTAYIFSTLSTNMEYALWQQNPGRNIKVKSVKIAGGANICRGGDDGKFYTPKGMVTRVSDEDLKLLKNNEVFQLHEKNGYIYIEGSEIKIDKAVQNMESEDICAPKTEKTLPNKKRKGDE